MSLLKKGPVKIVEAHPVNIGSRKIGREIYNKGKESKENTSKRKGPRVR
jgi:hypothetical protein